MKVVVIGKPGNFDPWRQEFISSIGPRFDVVTVSSDSEFRNELVGAIAVLDLGARVSTTMIGCARDAGVKLWQLVSTGYDHLDLQAFRDRQIVVANTPGLFSAQALAEHAMMLMLLVSKRYAESQRQLQAGVFYRAFGNELAGKVLGLVGFGASGRRLAGMSSGIGMRVVAIDTAKPSDADLAAANATYLGDSSQIFRLAELSDVVSLHVPLAPDTFQLVDERVFEAMKRTGILINVARGGIVDQAALMDALRSERIAGAGLDVFATEPIGVDDPILSLPNVVATPHVAASTTETAQRRGSAAAENVKRVVDGREPQFRLV